MKSTSLLRFAAIALFAVVLGAPVFSRAAETNAPAAAEKPGPNRFYGPITAINTNAMTFTVGDQIFRIKNESQITKDNKPAKLTDAIVGEPARGTYTKTADGKLDVTKVRFGKAGGNKAGGKNGGAKKKTGAPAAPSATTP
jgi:hypothetical protein